MIDNLSITNYKSNATFADYTVRYVDANGNEIKPSRTGNGQVGKSAKLMESDKESVYNEDKSKKFIYDSDDSQITPITTEGTVITVTFRDAEVYRAMLNCIIDGQTGSAARLATLEGTFFEGDTYNVYPARGYGKDGKYYFTDATSWNGVTYTFPGDATLRTLEGVTAYVGTLKYTLDGSVAYYSDVERPAIHPDYGGLGQLVGTVNSWWCFYGEGIYFDRFSQGRAIRLDAGSYVWTEPIAEDGTYMVRIYGRNDKSAECVAPYALGLRDAEGNVTLLDVDVPDWGKATTGESVIGNAAEDVEAAGIGIKAGYSLVILNSGNGKMISLDDVKLTKVTGYAETPTKAPAYTVAGAFVVEGSEEHSAAFFGEAWNPSINDMTVNEDGNYSLKFEKVTFEQSGVIYYKVAVNHGWTESYGLFDGNADYWVEVPQGQTRTADVIFTFNPVTKEVGCSVVTCEMTGDINGDGVVDVSDYIGIANFILGSAPEGFNEKTADVNNDGNIDVSDYIGVANIILTGSVYGK